MSIYDDDEDDSLKPGAVGDMVKGLGFLISVIISLVMQCNEFACNKEGNRSEYLMEGKSYAVRYDDCERVSTYLTVERIYKEGKYFQAAVVVNADSLLVITGSGPLVFDVCGRKEIGKVWSIDGDEKRIHVRVHPGYSLDVLR